MHMAHNYILATMIMTALAITSVYVASYSYAAIAISNTHSQPLVLSCLLQQYPALYSQLCTAELSHLHPMAHVHTIS